MAEQTKGGWDRIHYACGMNGSSVRKMCKFIFGEYFKELKLNPKDKMFDIYVYKTLNGVTFVEMFTQEYIDSFKEYWNEVPGFRLIYFLGISVEDL